MGKQGFFILLGLIMGFSGAVLAAEPGQSTPYGSLSYSPDRWPSRWSNAIQENHAWRGSELNRNTLEGEKRNMNPWAPESKSLFDSIGQNRPSVNRPWGEAPREKRRERERDYYSGKTPFTYGFNPYGQTFAPGFNAFGLPGFGYPGTYGQSYWPGAGAAYPYDALPYRRSYGGFPFGTNSSFWPFSFR